VRSYERWLLGEYHEEGFESWRSNALREMWRIADALSQGIPLGCWCGEWNSGLDEPPICHATVLVRLARGWFSPHGWVLTSRTIPTFGGEVHAGRPAQIESIWRDSIGLVCNVTMRDGRTISALPLNALAPLVGGTRSIASSPEAGTAA